MDGPSIPSGSSSLPPVTLGGIKGISGELRKLPQSFIDAAATGIIKGEIIAHKSYGSTQIKTDLGILEIMLTQKIPVGSQVSLEIQTQGTGFRVTVLNIIPPKKSAGIFPTPSKPMGAHTIPTGSLGAPIPQDLPEGASPPAVSVKLPLPDLQVGHVVEIQATPLAKALKGELAPPVGYEKPAVFTGISSSNKGAGDIAKHSPDLLKQAFQPQSPPEAAETVVSSAQKPSLSDTPSQPKVVSNLRGAGLLSPDVLVHAQSEGGDQPPRSWGTDSPLAKATLPEGTRVPIRVVDFPFYPTSEANLPPAQSMAKIAGFTPKGEVILTTPTQTFVVPGIGSDKPLHTAVIVDFDPFQPVPVIHSSSPSGLSKGGDFSLHPPFSLPDVGAMGLPKTSLEGLLRILNLTPQLSIPAGVPLPVISTPAPDMAIKLLYSLLALRGAAELTLMSPSPEADPEIVDFSRVLQAEGRNLQPRFTSELTQPPSPLTNQGEWKALQLPFLQGGVYHPLTFHYRREKGSGKADVTETYTRMVIDLNLSRLGEMRLDGIFAPKRFDLALKSTRPLPDFAQRELSALFYAQIEASGFAGNISFGLRP